MPFLIALLLAFASLPVHAQGAEHKQQVSAGPADKEKKADSLRQEAGSAKEEHWTYNQASAPQQHDTDNQESPWTKANVFVQGALAVITAIIAGFAVAAYLQSKNSSERQLRAYVTVKESKRGYNDDNTRHGVIHTILNTGQTPAYELSFGGVEAIYPVSILMQRTVRTLGHGQDFQFHTPIDPGHGGHEGVKFIGRIEYRDAFNKRRWTNFRYRATWDSQVRLVLELEEIQEH